MIAFQLALDAPELVRSLVMSEVEMIERSEELIAQLVQAWRPFFAGPAGEETQPRGRRPVKSRAKRREGSEIAEMADCAIEVGAQPPDR